MNFKRSKLSLISSGVALGLAAMSLQAADQPMLTAAGAQPTAMFSGGATLNGGASFLKVVPAGDAADLLATIKPAAADVGKMGSLVVILEVPTVGFFNLLSGGIWVPTDLSSIQPYATKMLAASEQVTVLDDLIGSDTNLTGLTLSAYVGYYTGGDLASLTFSATPASMAIATAPTGCPTGTTASAGITFEGKPVCNIPTGAPITQNMHLTSNNNYFFSGTAFIGNNTVNTPDAEKVSLTIYPGVKILSEGGQSALVINRGGKIFANGTPAKPIVMSTSQDPATIDKLNARGLWGGLTINGSATLNTASGFDDGEGSTGQYGGGTTPNNADSSGSITYLQVLYAGFPITADDELNTISLQGVGSGTILDYIHSHNGADDGIEFYGGTVNAKHVLITGHDDDALDWTTGYTGKLQHILVKHTTSGDNCIEADNLGANPVATPRSQPVISNLTCITSTGQKSDGHAFELKAGTGMNLGNAVIFGPRPAATTEGCIRINNADTFSQSGTSAAALNGTLTMQYSRIPTACAADLQGSGTFTTAEWFAAQMGTSAGAVELGGPDGWANGIFVNAVTPVIPTDSFFDQVDYIGAVKDDSSDWTKGWTFKFD